MTGALATRPGSEVTFSDDQIGLIKRQILKPAGRAATTDELDLFIYQCRRTGLDPLARQIYGIFRFNRQSQQEEMSIQTGIDGFRLIAERTGKYLGQTPAYWAGQDLQWSEVWNKSGSPYVAKVGVYKEGRQEPTVAVARWSSYNAGGPLWSSMPDNQLAKCAEALALRKTFPNELSGLYIPEEMDQADNASPKVVANGSDSSAPGEVEEVTGEIVEPKRADAIGEAAALEIFESTKTVEAITPDLFAQAVAFVVDRDVGDLSTEEAAVPVLSQLTDQEAEKVTNWVARKRPAQQKESAK